MTDNERIQALKESVKKYNTFGTQTVEFLLSVLDQRDKTIAEKDAEIERLRGELKEIRYRAILWPSPFANEVRNMIDALFLGRKWRKARPDLSNITEEEILAARKAQDGER